MSYMQGLVTIHWRQKVFLIKLTCSNLKQPTKRSIVLTYHLNLRSFVRRYLSQLMILSST